MSGTLRFEILGPQRAWYADREIDLGPGKQRAVLAVLLLSAGRPVTTAQIVDAVWPEDPPANGPNVVQKHVAGLRRVLEPERSPRTPGQVLTRTDAGYLLRVDPEEVDAVRFERGVRRAERHREAGRTAEAAAELRTALDLWRGEPFTGFGGPFFDAARQRCVELRATALESWIDLGLGQGRHRELVGTLVELVAEFPVREPLRHQLMLALFRSGRQAEALAAYRDVDELLREEYGLEPGEELRELHRRILRADPTLLLPAATSPTPTDAQPPPVPVPSPRLPVPARTPLPAVPSAASRPATVPVPDPPAVFVRPPARDARRRTQARRVPRWASVSATVVGTLLVLVSLGFLTWLVVLAHAAWRRSWLLTVAGVGHLAVLAGFVRLVAGIDPDPAVELTDAEFLGILGYLLVCWPVGAVHVVLLNRRVRGIFTGGDRAAEERRIHREHARFLLHHHPAARHELRIGRPDLPRTFDDGGLIDVNSVPDVVLARLPGLTPDQCRMVAADRWRRGPYVSVEELAGRCLLPPTSTEQLRDVLLFLPRSPSPHHHDEDGDDDLPLGNHPFPAGHS
ncbi:BTAD domain-containing putative transcriptional regulator [Micromonospora sp. NPDC049799]|uniref:BTAD domain-containing putative transcriptional regulator n=1 Tax=Micromonospora sp. NPDC049799 TaxID=3154741 RepID=UPI0033D6E5D0